MPFLLLGRTDDSDIDTIVWPDTCAIAERLWSPADASPDTSQALIRLIPQRCRMYQPTNA